MIKIEKLIMALRLTDKYIETIFTEGSCYQFHLFLKQLNGDAKPYFTEDREHVVTLIDGLFLDITGDVSSEQGYILMTDDDIEIAEKWSFSKSKMIQLGECSLCEEPILA